MDYLTQTLAGSAFGAALTASGVWKPAIILDQMRFHDLHMLKVFMTASSASALMMHLLSRAGVVPNKPRPASSLFTGFSYDGNIIGGAMVGFGMTLTGACPGTVLVQLVTGTYPGVYSFIGGIAGGIAYHPVQRLLRRTSSCPKSGEENLLLYKKLRVSANASVLTYEAMCVAVIGLATALAPPSGKNPFLPPVIGGLCIGAAQLVSLLLRGAPVGISTAYENFGAKVCGLFDRTEKGKLASLFTPSAAMAFTAGVMLGVATMVRMVPRFAATEVALNLGISPARAVVGGFIMVLGARLAGGCSSGHGISGMSMLATSSIITVTSMFAGGMGLAQVL